MGALRGVPVVLSAVESAEFLDLGVAQSGEQLDGGLQRAIKQAERVEHGPLRVRGVVLP